MEKIKIGGIYNSTLTTNQYIVVLKILENYVYCYDLNIYDENNNSNRDLQDRVRFDLFEQIFPLQNWSYFALKDFEKITNGYIGQLEENLLKQLQEKMEEEIFDN